jgi:hypothetical protein
MLRKRAARRSAGKQQKNAQSTNTRRAVTTSNTLPVARVPAAAAGAVEERLNSVAKEVFQNMGED